MTFLTIASARLNAGWEVDPSGSTWLAPDGTPDYEWQLAGYPFPEDADYTPWWDAFMHYELLDSLAPANAGDQQ